MYIDKFEEIRSLINKFGYTQSVEDIANLDTNTKQKVSQYRLLLKEINKAIKNGILNKNGIKL